jgi:hypothetical protein
MGAIVGTGMVFRVIPRTKYTFDNLAITGGAVTIFPIASHIDVSPFQEVDVQVRVHAYSVTSGSPFNGAGLGVLVAPDGFTMEDPVTVFQGTNVNTPFNSTGYFVTNLTGVFGRLVSVSLGVQLPATSVANLNCTLSIDLACKQGDPSGIMPAYNTYRGYR